MLKRNTKKMIIINSFVFIIILGVIILSSKVYATDVDLSNEVSIPVTSIIPEIDTSNETSLLPVIIPIEEANETPESNNEDTSTNTGSTASDTTTTNKNTSSESSNSSVETFTSTNDDIKNEIDNSKNEDIENKNVIDNKDSIVVSNIDNETETANEQKNNKIFVLIIIIVIVIALLGICIFYKKQSRH